MTRIPTPHVNPGHVDRRVGSRRNDPRVSVSTLRVQRMPLIPLASGRPVIATCRAGTEIATVVSECGLVVPPGDGAALATAIERLADDGAGRTLLGQKARLYAEKNLTKEAVLARMLSMFLKV